MKHILDAQNKKVGRVASQAASLLMGKNSTEFVRNAIPKVEVEIVNAAKAEVSTKRKEEPLKARYSLYPGGLVEETVGEVIAKKGYKELFRKAVSGMLPRNKLRAKMMKNLTISE
jgi:large subunit ribosomal protein L13